MSASQKQAMPQPDQDALRDPDAPAASSRRASPSEIVTVREPQRTLSLNLAELWRYRELLQLLVWRNTVVRYKQSVVGVGWAVIKPLGSMVIMSVIFGGLAGFNRRTGGIPYPIFNYAALLPWMYFASSLAGISESLVGAAGLMSKVYFPRLILPLSTLATSLVDFAISFTVLLGLMAWYHEHVVITWRIVCLPAFLGLAMATALAVGLWFGSLMVKYRDVQHVLPFLTQIWMYLSPVIYPASEVPQRFRLLYALNPMTGAIDGFRWALLGPGAVAAGEQALAAQAVTQPHWGALALSAALVLALLVGGLYFFRRTERTFVDIV